MALDHLDHRRALDLVLGEKFGEERRFQDVQADVEADRDQEDAEEKRHPPSPDQEFVAGQPAESQHGQVRQEQAGRHAELRPGRNETPMRIGLGPLHGHQYRAAPLATDAYPLQEAQHRQQHRAPDADLLVSRDERDQEGCDAHQHERGDERGFAPDAVAVVAEDRRADGPRDEAYGVDGKGLQGADHRIGLREIQLREHQPGDDAVQEEVVPLDGRADRAGDDRAPQLSPVLLRR